MKNTFSNSGNPEFIVELQNNATDDEFVKVVPYGDAPQMDAFGNRVVQRFEREDAETLVASFKNNAKRLARKFGAMLGLANNNIPFYECHADTTDSEPANHTVFAEATDLEAREDGLYAKIKRSSLWDALKEALGELQISPYWTAESMDGKVYRPVKLISFGMVKKGNIPNACLANSAEMDKALIGKCAEMLGIEEKDFSVDLLVEKLESALEVPNQLAEANGRLDELDKELRNQKEVCKNYQSQIGDFVINESVAQGKITADEVEGYRARMAGDDFDATVELLRSMNPIANTEIGKETAPEQTAPESKNEEEKEQKQQAIDDAKKGAEMSKNRGDIIAEEVNKIMNENGVDYETAFTIFAITKRGRELLTK